MLLQYVGQKLKLIIKFVTITDTVNFSAYYIPVEELFKAS